MFEQKIEEAYAFATGSYMNVDELRRLYYGRIDLYVSFTNEANLQYSTTSTELDRPDGIVCYAVNDVVGRKKNTSDFYGWIFRARYNGKNIKNIRQYNNTDLYNDLEKLNKNKYVKEDVLFDIINEITGDTAFYRHPFQQFWGITEFVAKAISNTSYGSVWKDILTDLGYSAFHDQSMTGWLTGRKEPAVLYLDYASRIDLDIVEIQKYRKDPRARVRNDVYRKVMRFSNARNRISKKRKYVTNDENISFIDLLTKFRDLL